MGIIKVRDAQFHEPRTEWLGIRLSVQEKRKLVQHAKDSGLSVSSFIRQRLVYEQPDLMGIITNNYAKSLEVKGLERGVPIRPIN